MRHKGIIGVALILVVVVMGGLFVFGGDKRMGKNVVVEEDKKGEEVQEEKDKKIDVQASEMQGEQEETDTVLDVNKLDAGTVVSGEQVIKEKMDSYFVSNEISDAVFARINGKSYRENNDIKLEQLRYLKVLHYNFDHKVQVGEIIVNAALAEDFIKIFKELFENEYEIFSMYLIDNFWTGDGVSSDSASVKANNTSAFCYRQIIGSKRLSNHALGCAVDINPQQNPYVTYKGGKPIYDHENASGFIDRKSGAAHMITHDDLCFKVFKKYGFTWGGDWNSPKDYQHFEKRI